jgi:hypothetical protein
MCSPVVPYFGNGPFDPLAYADATAMSIVAPAVRLEMARTRRRWNLDMGGLLESTERHRLDRAAMLDSGDVPVNYY